MVEQNRPSGEFGRYLALARQEALTNPWKARNHLAKARDEILLGRVANKEQAYQQLNELEQLLAGIGASKHYWWRYCRAAAILGAILIIISGVCEMPLWLYCFIWGSGMGGAILGLLWWFRANRLDKR